MKKQFILLCAGLLLASAAKAQEFIGIATYESKMRLPDESLNNEKRPEMGEEMDAMIKEALEKAMHKTYTLTFDKNESVFIEEEKLAPIDPRVNVTINREGEGIQYKNLKDNKLLVETSLYDKEFLISDSLPKCEWKLESETKKIGNYTCYKATAVVKPAEEHEEDKTTLLGAIAKDDKITVWYTPDIPVSNGPSNFWGLPGLILEANDGITTYLCSKIVLNPKQKVEIKAPKKGKKITSKEFEKLAIKKAKEFEDANGGSNVKTIIIGG